MAEKYEFRLTIEGPEKALSTTLQEGQVIIGRQVGNDLLLEHPQISRKHARLDCDPRECHLTDLNSSNGTFVNDEKITPEVPVRLSPGDTIKVGPFSLRFTRHVMEVPEPQEQPATREIPAEATIEEAQIGEAPHPLQASGKIEPPIKKPPKKAKVPPSPPPPEAPPGPPPSDLPEEASLPPGLATHSLRLIDYLPDIYHTDFMSRFLAIFESILLPIEWNIDNYDLFLSPGTIPSASLPWFVNLFRITFDQSWDEAKRRRFLEQAFLIYERRGTSWALSKVLEIYTGFPPEIVDQDEDLEPFTFKIRLPVTKKQTDPELVAALIEAYKPAHTTYELQFKAR